MAKTISFVKGKGSLRHNNRDFIASNIDEKRIPWNVTYIQQSLSEAYEQLFGEAVAEYNSKQRRSDRKIDDYLSKIKHSGNNEKIIHCRFPRRRSRRHIFRLHVSEIFR